MGFTSACLTVGKNSSIVSKHHIFDYLQGALVIYLFLVRILIINVVECVRLTHFIWRWWLVVLRLIQGIVRRIDFAQRLVDSNLSRLIIDLNDLRMSTLKLIFVPWSTTNGDPYCFALTICRHSHIRFIEEAIIGLRTCQSISTYRSQIHAI